SRLKMFSLSRSHREALDAWRRQANLRSAWQWPGADRRPVYRASSVETPKERKITRGGCQSNVQGGIVEFHAQIAQTRLKPCRTFSIKHPRDRFTSSEQQPLRNEKHPAATLQFFPLDRSLRRNCGGFSRGS